MPIGGTVGQNRADAIYRILFVVLLALGGVVILGLLWAIGLIAGLLWMLVDVVMQLATNDRGWTSGRMSGPASWLERLFYWPIDMIEWTLYGTGGFPWLP